MTEAEYRELLKDPQVRKVVARFLSVSESTIGSTLPPAFLREYDQIHPGAAHLVFARYEMEGVMARDEQLHRHAMEDRWLTLEIESSTTELRETIKITMRGQIFSPPLSPSCS